MSAGIPVMIHLDRDTFRALERAAKSRGTTMRDMIEHASGLIAGTRTNRVGHTRAADEATIDEWVDAATRGMTNQQIAHHWHVSTQLVSRRLLERGIRRRAPRTATT